MTKKVSLRTKRPLKNLTWTTVGMFARAAAAPRTTRNLTLITRKRGVMKTKALYAVVVVVILLALWRIGASIYEYHLSVIDRNAPTIPSELMQPPVFIPDPPPPPAEHLPRTLPPHEVQPQPPAACYTNDCTRRQLITI